jgi:hypothetical protein
VAATVPAQPLTVVTADAVAVASVQVATALDAAADPVEARHWDVEPTEAEAFRDEPAARNRYG